MSLRVYRTFAYNRLKSAKSYALVISAKDQVTLDRVLDEMFISNGIMLKRIGGMVPLEFSISSRKYNQLFNNMGTVYFYNSLIYINIDKEFLPGIVSRYKSLGFSNGVLQAVLQRAHPRVRTRNPRSRSANGIAILKCAFCHSF